MSTYNNVDIKNEVDILKIILLGDSYVGKTNVITRFTNNNFILESKSTIGIDFNNVEIDIENKLYSVQIWDTAGQERFRSFLTTYFKGTHGIILVYDITNEDSFQSVTDWLNEIKKNLKLQDIKIILVGNKLDLEEKREVSIEKAKKLAEENNFLFLETSAKTNISINELFKTITKELVNKFNFKPNTKEKTLNARDMHKINYTKKIQIEKKKCC